MAGAVLVGAAAGALVDGGSAYLKGARGNKLLKATGKGALFGGATAGLGWGVGKGLEYGLGKLATKGFKPGNFSKYIRIERHNLAPAKKVKINGVAKDIGHINIGKTLHIIKPSTAKKIRGNTWKFIYKGSKK